VLHLARVTARPFFVAGMLGGGGGGGNGPRLGIQPTYPEDEKGVLLAGVSDGGPAGKAGLKAGDRIVELAGKQIKKLEEYMEVMGAQKAGTTIDVVVERDGKKMTVKVKLE
jgi:S1-C subfamily serine protease